MVVGADLVVITIIISDPNLPVAVNCFSSTWLVAMGVATTKESDYAKKLPKGQSSVVCIHGRELQVAVFSSAASMYCKTIDRLSTHVLLGTTCVHVLTSQGVAYSTVD